MKSVVLKWLAGLAGGAACASVGYLAVHSHQAPAKAPTHRAKTASAPTSSPLAADTSPRDPGCAFHKGDLVSYRLELTDRSTIDMSALGFAAAGAKSTHVSQSTRATLDLKALGDTADAQTLLLGKFRSIENSAVQKDDRLETPFLLRVTDKCDIAGYAYSENARLPYARVQQAVLYELQWRWPGKRNEAFESRNNLGTYRARLASTTQGATTRVYRRIVHYTPWHKGPGATRHVNDSLLTVVPGDGPWFDSLALDERVAGKQSTTHRTLVASRVDAPHDHLADLPTGDDHYVWADLLPSALPLPERQPPTRQHLAAVARARKQTFKKAVDSYVARVQDKKTGIQDTWPPLRDYLEAHPEKTETIVKKLKRRQIPADATMGVYIAMGNTPTTQAKDALDGIMRDTHAPVFERARAMLSLVDRDDVGPDTAHYMSERASLIESGKSRAVRVMARQSMLALGAIAGLHPGDPQLRDIAVERIKQTLPTVKLPLDKRPIFGALANVGDPALLRLVAHISDDPDARTREYAAIVVRRMPPHKTGDFEASWLQKETNWNVKRALYKTIELQTYDARQDPSPAVLRQAVKDLETIPGPITRKAIIRLLARAKDRMTQNHVQDDLGIEAAFLKLIPYELKHNSGLYMTLAEHVDAKKLDKVTVDAIEAMNHKPGAPTQTADAPAMPDPGASQTPPGSHTTNSAGYTHGAIR